jgi:hypothetical protein
MNITKTCSNCKHISDYFDCSQCNNLDEWEDNQEGKLKKIS